MSALILLGVSLPALLGIGFTSLAAEPEARNSGKTEVELFETAYQLHMSGELEEAIRFYGLSIEVKPTAKAHTFLGWAYSHQGNYDKAIAECLKAIELDPDYGNPYNDIGAYYIEKGMYEEAIPFLKQAIEAKDYLHYEFPHFNLGRVYVTKGMYREAMEEFKKALEIEPNYLPAQVFLEMLSRYTAET
ncbi:MAG: tetratricopeptide repeat protein [Proteobacteria bacterium]|nr:tetratricopeptide repeat protein [Pseudomonadota bacterium]NIS63495.1 tetratricopeptide repeat protein [Pseudomonadota bacterium]